VVAATARADADQQERIGLERTWLIWLICCDEEHHARNRLTVTDRFAKHAKHEALAKLLPEWLAWPLPPEEFPATQGWPTPAEAFEEVLYE
jgi:hypothetical protein